MTIKNRYPLPLISELMNKLRGAKYFSQAGCSTGDIIMFGIKMGDEWKAAFRTNQGLYEPTVIVLWAHQLARHFPMDDE